MTLSNLTLALPKIAIIGRPNVGKSCLFNRLAKQKIAITSHLSGTTRDTNYTYISLLSPNQSNALAKDQAEPKQEANALLIDTGGIELKNKDELFLEVGKRAKQACTQADLILYMVDGANPPNDEDRTILYEILGLTKDKPCFLVVNKIDSDAQNEGGYLFYEFGVQDVFFISVAHNRGISALQNAIFSAVFSQFCQSENPHFHTNIADDEHSLLLSLESSIEKAPEQMLDSSQNSEIKIGIIGRVNVGKSSLLNALTQTERAIVSKVAGTTIDPVDESIEHKGIRLTFVDTAGIRKRGKIEELEKFALDRTNKILAQSDIALLVLDVSEGFCELDERIFSLTQKHALGVIVLWNKWDIKYADFASIQAEFARKFRFLEYAPTITISAKNKRHISELKDKILEVYQNFSLRIKTAKLNEVIAKALQNHAIPSDKGRLVKIYYATQYSSKPPQIALICNRPKSIHFSYKRYLINVLRDEFGLSGVPIVLDFKDKNAKTDEVDIKPNKDFKKIDFATSRAKSAKFGTHKISKTSNRLNKSAKKITKSRKST